MQESLLYLVNVCVSTWYMRQTGCTHISATGFVEVVYLINFSLTGESRGGDDEQNVLRAFKFRLDGFTEEQEMQLQENIENYGGSVLSNQSKAIAEFLVVPLNYDCRKKKARNVVSIGLSSV